jgi:hypothetical protein
MLASGLDVLVNDAAPVHVANGSGQTDGEAQEQPELHRMSQELIEPITFRNCAVLQCCIRAVLSPRMR